MIILKGKKKLLRSINCSAVMLDLSHNFESIGIICERLAEFDWQSITAPDCNPAWAATTPESTMAYTTQGSRCVNHVPM